MNTLQGIPINFADEDTMNNPLPFTRVLMSSPLDEHAKLGRLLLDAGKLQPSDVERILLLQKHKPMLFGEAALKLGVAEAADIQQALARQFDHCLLQPGAGGMAPELLAAFRPHGKEMENLRRLRSRLARSWFQRGRRELALAAVNRQEGVSLMAANLAVCFARHGERTLLIDANLRAPRQHAIFNLRTQLGLSDMLAGRAGTETIVSLNAIPGLSVLGAGTAAPNPHELLGRPSFPILRDRLRAQFDVILYDTPACALGEDALAIAADAGGMLVVARRHKTSMAEMRALGAHLQESGTAIAGSVLNEF